MNHWVIMLADEQQLSDLKRPYGLAGHWMSKWKGALGLSLWSTTVFIDHLKKDSLPPLYASPLLLLHRPTPNFNYDGWSNAIRSNYSSASASSLSLPQTPHRHALLRQEGKTWLCSAAPLSIHSLIHLSTHSSCPLVFIHHVFRSLGHSCSLCPGILLSASPPTCSCSPSFHPHSILTI